MIRRLKANKSCQVPSQHIILDTETIRGEPVGVKGIRRHTFRCACAAFFRWERGRPTREKRFETCVASDMIDWIKSHLDERRMTWLWAHSLKFDLASIGMWDVLESRTLHLKFACLDSLPNFIMAESANGPLWMIDSLNWLRSSLANVGDTLATPKLSMPSMNQCVKDWLMYCWRDVDILKAAIVSLLRFSTENDLGCLRLSAPGQAMQAWKHRFAPRVKRLLPTYKDRVLTGYSEQEVLLPLIHGQQEVRKLERAAYFQGQVRVNYIGIAPEPIYCLDVNSCYPSVMLDGLVPTELDDYEVSNGERRTLESDSYERAIARVKVSTIRATYPFRNGDHTVYPVGTFNTTLCGPELVLARDRGDICAVYEWATYKVGNIFKDFISYFWGLRTEYNSKGNRVMADLCKVIMNSLPGKFGQLSHRWENDNDITPPFPWGRWDQINPETGEWGYYRSLAWLAQKQMPRVDHPESFPAVAAWVTSLARVKMNKLLEGLAYGCKVYYSAVDSIHCNARGYQQLDRLGCISPGIGCLRLEKIGECVDYRGIANYTIDGVHHVAGLPSRAIIEEGQGRNYRYSEIAATHPISGRDSCITELYNKRPVGCEYVHGQVEPSGWTRPWILPLEQEQMASCLKKATHIFGS